MEAVANTITGLVTANAQLAGMLLLLMTGCFALSAHLGKIVVYGGAGLLIVAVLLALHTVSSDFARGPMKPVDLFVVVVCVGSVFWACRNLAFYHDRTSNGMVSQTD